MILVGLVLMLALIVAGVVDGRRRERERAARLAWIEFEARMARLRYLGASLALAGVAAKAVKAYADYEASMDRLRITMMYEPKVLKPEPGSLFRGAIS